MTFALRNEELAGQPGLTTPQQPAVSMAAPGVNANCGPAILPARAGGPVRDAEQLAGLIGRIYDAATEPALWPAAIRQTAEFVGGMSGALFYKDAAAKRGNVYYECGGNDPHYKRLYFEEYIKIDPSSVGHCFAEIGKPLGMSDILDLDEFHASRFYQEWVRPQRSADNVTVALDKSATGAALFAVFRHERQGLADAEMRRRMGLIASHVRRAALIGRAIEHRTAEAETFADALDGLGAAMFLVDADGRVVHANASGAAMLREALVVRSASGRLASTDARATRALGDAVAAAKGGDAAVGSRGIAVPLAGRDGERYVAHALPLTSAARRRTGARHAAVAALLVQKAALQMRSAPEVIARAFELTPSELRVLLAVVEAGGVPETAEALGIGQATVKTHLHRLFCKTATRRQAELVKLVAGFSSPLVG